MNTALKLISNTQYIKLLLHEKGNYLFFFIIITIIYLYIADFIFTTNVSLQHSVIFKVDIYSLLLIVI